MENYIKTAIRYAEGKMSGSDFEIEQASEPELWPWLQSLLTEEMKTDPKHEFWNICHSRSALEANNFRVKATALAFGYGFFGNMHEIGNSAALSRQFTRILKSKHPRRTQNMILCTK